MNKLINYLQSNLLAHDEGVIAKFETYYSALVEWNNKCNLTAITDRNDVIVKHFIDSLLGASYIAPDSTVIDIGAGAGFPSLPLAIALPTCRFDMVDSTNKKILFLEYIIKQLDLNNAFAFHARAEDFITDRRAIYDIALARAVAPLPILLEYLAPYVKVGGKLIAYKGDNYAAELKASDYALHLLGCELDRVDSLSLADEYSRNMIIINKVKPCLSIYPRGGNKPRIAPLIK